MSRFKRFMDGRSLTGRRAASGRCRVEVERLEDKALLSDMWPIYGPPTPPPAPPPPMIPPPAATPTPPPTASAPPPAAAAQPSAPTPATPPPAPMPTGPAASRHGHHLSAASHNGGGVVRKAAHFYEFYVGPMRADLNVVAASVQLHPGRSLVLTGTMAGNIDKHPRSADADSFFVFGINRGSSKAVAPFYLRPGVMFDSVVVASVTHANGVSGAVVDLTTGVKTPLSAANIRIMGRQVRVTIDPALLPTPPGGVPLGQATFNLWPQSNAADNPVPNPNHESFVASFIPEDGMAPIQVLKR